MSFEQYKISYLNALQEMPAPGDGFNLSLLGVTNLGVLCGREPDEIKADILQYMKTGTREPTHTELDRAINKSQHDLAPERILSPSEYGQMVNRSAISPKTQEQTDPHKVRDLKNEWIKTGRKVISRPEDLVSLSPVKLSVDPLWNCLTFLNTLYANDEFLFIGDRHHTDVMPVSYWKDHIEKHGAQGWPHIVPNPMTGRLHETQEDKQSRRCDASVAAYRFVVAEFDKMALPKQLAFWVGSPFPVSAIIFSGGKSYHALIRIDEDSQEAWDSLVKGRIKPLLSMMGADPATFNPSRLSRLPGHHRQDKGQWQQLIYLNSEPKGGILDCVSG